MPRLLTDARLRRADHVGIVASLLCALHCALLPIALALLPTLGLKVGGWVDIDQALVVFTTVLAVASLWLGYRRHRIFRAWSLLLPGLALIWIATFSPIHDHARTDWLHAGVMVLGGLLLASAHWLNLRLSHAHAA